MTPARALGALLLLTSSIAQGQPVTGIDPSAIGVLAVETSGVSETAGDKFEQSVEETLSDVGRRVVRSKWIAAKLARSDYVAGCTFGPCMKEVRRAIGLERVLVARIEGAGQSYSVVVSLIDTEDGRLVSQVAQSCPVCTVEEAISTATLAVVELVNEKTEAAVAPAAAVDVEARARMERKQRHVRRAGWAFLAVGLIAGGVGAYLVSQDEEAGAPTVGAGGGLAVAGLATLLLSVTF